MYDEKFIAAVAVRLAVHLRHLLQTSGNGKQSILPKLLTVKDAATYLGRTEQSVQHLIFRRELPVVRAGRRVHLLRDDLDGWITRNRE